MRIRPEPQKLGYVFEFPLDADLTRLNFYAPFVKTLRSTGLCAITNLIPTEWAILSSGIIMKPLLPNLERLIMNTLGDRADESHVKWVSRFLYRGLLAFEMLPSPLGGGEDYYPWLDVRTSFYLIDQVSRA
ncbi:hypothetical protein FRC12_003620, partial [Ceratobasidium sp. 428]